MPKANRLILTYIRQIYPIPSFLSIFFQDLRVYHHLLQYSFLSTNIYNHE